MFEEMQKQYVVMYLIIVHIKCNSMSTSKYDKLCEEDIDESFICICFNSELPFGLESETTFNQTLPFWRSSNLGNLDTSISKQDKKLTT